MSGILWFLFLLTAIFITVIVAGIFWSIKSGQFDDLDSPGERILMDEDDPMLPSNQKLKDKAE
ncbi:MAG: cbb3-type cytochrome oxidase assembly protein CcoS [Thiobacillaceae bacterium]